MDPWTPWLLTPEIWGLVQYGWFHILTPLPISVPPPHILDRSSCLVDPPLNLVTLALDPES